MVEMMALIEAVDSDFMRGNLAPEEVAAEWQEAGFDAGEVSEWAEAGCFSPEAAQQLRAEGLQPHDGAMELGDDLGMGGYRGTLAYKLSNDDISMELVRVVASWTIYIYRYGDEYVAVGVGGTTEGMRTYSGITEGRAVKGLVCPTTNTGLCPGNCDRQWGEPEDQALQVGGEWDEATYSHTFGEAAAA